VASQLGPKLTAYLGGLEASNHPILAEMESVAADEDFPIIGPQCGRVLATLAVAIGARRVFEMGSGYGYSTLWFAAAVGEGGEVVHTDGVPANTERAREYLSRAGLVDRVRFLNGDATELLSMEEHDYDCILIDIDKDGYPLAFQAAMSKLRVGGLLFAHNNIWSGRVAEDERNPQTDGIRQYNAAVMGHTELLSFIDPVHDGLAVSLKVPASLRAKIPV
jgi:predicted O-methyltransferase YrrM